MKQTVEVVAALIRDGQKFLICRRPAHKARGLLWEFVGGKVEQGETPEQALIRECREELAITVKPFGEFAKVRHEYPDIIVNLTLFECKIESGEPRLIEHADMKWIAPSEIPDYEFCPADVEILNKLMA
ncbi:MAG: 8-oxo-dGTP diphosphatase MutT [Candidatus Coproplasma sp.]